MKRRRYVKDDDASIVHLVVCAWLLSVEFKPALSSDFCFPLLTIVIDLKVCQEIRDAGGDAIAITADCECISIS